MLAERFRMSRRKLGFKDKGLSLDTSQFQVPQADRTQLSLF
jgi:hypothetical protein